MLADHRAPGPARSSQAALSSVNGFVKPCRAGSGNSRGPRVHGLWSPSPGPGEGGFLKMVLRTVMGSSCCRTGTREPPHLARPRGLRIQRSSLQAQISQASTDAANPQTQMWGDL